MVESGNDMTDFEVGRYALRTWNISTDGALCSVIISGSHWHGGTCTAQCLGDDLAHWQEPLRVKHETPHPQCQCGIYGSLSLDHLVSQYPHHAATLLGVIAAEGITILGSRGLRTQFARVVAYWSPPFRDIVAKEFVDAECFDDLNKMLTTYQIPWESPTNPSRGIASHPQGPDFWKVGE